jgi:hypothetical protein
VGKKVAELNIRGAWCRSIARRSIRGEFLTYQDQRHIEQHVIAVPEAARTRTAAKGTPQDPSHTPKRGGQAA